MNARHYQPFYRGKCILADYNFTTLRKNCRIFRLTKFSLLQICNGYPSVRFCFLRRQAARKPKKTPKAVNTQMMRVAAISLTVVMPYPA